MAGSLAIFSIGALNTSTAFSGTIYNNAGTTGLAKVGTGTLTLSGANITYTGPTTVSGGTLQYSAGTGFNSPTNVGPAGTLLVNITGGNVNLGSSGSLSGSGPVQIVGNANTARFYGNDSAYSGTFTLSSSARGIMWDSAASGSPLATWNLSGQFALMEGFAGTVQLGALQGSNAATILSAYSGTGSKTFQVGALGANATFAGTISDANFAGSTANGSIYFQKIGTGMQTLSGSNAYSGDTTVTQGTLQVGSASAIPSGTNKGNLVFDTPGNTAVFDINGFNTTVNGPSQPTLTSTNLIVNNGGSGLNTLTVGGNNTTTTFGGVLADNNNGGSGLLAVTKTGSGTLTLLNANTYSGTTNVNAGVLVVNGASSGTGALTVASGATLSGIGLISAAGTLNSGSFLAPGARR